MRLRLSLALLVLAVSIPVLAADYVLDAGRWGEAQAAAVAAAGGTVHFAHASGLAIVTSDNPNFLADASVSGAFNTVAQDTMVQWQKPSPTVDFEELAVTAGNETFWNMQWAPTAVNAEGAWNAGYTGAGVRVAILDGGLYAAHVDLAPNVDVARSKSFVPGFAFNQDVGTFWHGTHVAGIVAAADNNGGVIGIAPGATLIGVKVLHNGTGSFGWIIAGILYASDPIADGGAGADIINMSLGATFPKAGGAGPLIGAMAKAVNYAASKGVLVVSAAGNDAMDLGQSSSFTSVPAESGSGIAVSASGPIGWALGNTSLSNLRRPASYSNYGEGTITLAGPGGDSALPGNALCVKTRIPVGPVTLPCWAFDMVISTARGTTPAGALTWSSGTSMAAPAVSAVAALAKQAHPTLSLGALKAKLQQSADDEGKKGKDEFYGHGYVNAGKAVQ
jgi:lantibiotic leader peptide-processing serine protease